MANVTDVNRINSFDEWLMRLPDKRRSYVMGVVLRTITRYIGGIDTWLATESYGTDGESYLFIPSKELNILIDPEALVGHDSIYLMCLCMHDDGARCEAVRSVMDTSAESDARQKALFEVVKTLMTSIILAVVAVDEQDDGGQASVSLIFPTEQDPSTVEEEKLHTTALPFSVYITAVASEAGLYDDDMDRDLLDYINHMLELEPTEDSEVPKLEGLPVITHVVPNSKVTQVLRNHETAHYVFDEGGAQLDVGGKRSGQTLIDFSLWYNEPTTQLSGDIDAEDMGIVEAVTSLKCRGNSTISPYQIAETMGYDNPSKDLQAEIHGRVVRLMGLVGRIDWTEQAKAWRVTNPETGEPFDRAVIMGNLLSLQVFEGVDVMGNPYVRYQINAEPITYTHARLIGQVVNYDQALLGLKPIDEDGNPVKRVTREQKKLQRAVLWYVHALKNPKSHLNARVSYEALFAYEGFVPTSASARTRAIRFIQRYLRALQANGTIYGFTALTEGGRSHKQTGVHIVVEKPRRRLR